MNPEQKKYSYIVYLLAFTLLISLIAIYFSFEKSEAPEFSHLMNLIAIFITSTAFIIGCYFATLAVNAFSHVKELETAIADVKKISMQLNDLSIIEDSLKESIERIHEVEKTFDLMFSDSADAIDLILSHEIDILQNRKIEESEGPAAKENHKKKYDAIYRRRVRLCYVKKLDVDRRLSLFTELAKYGDDSDIFRLEKVFNDKEEPPEIVDLAKGIRNILIRSKNNSPQDS